MKKILILLILLLSKQIYCFVDGDLDPSFNPNSQFSPTIPGTIISKIQPRASTATDIQIQSDGKYLVCGLAELNTNSAPPTKMIVARYNKDGSLDSTFAATNQIPNVLTNNQPGVIEITIGESSIAAGLAIQKDGKIVIIGSQTPDLASPNFINVVVIRLLPNGDLDTSFAPIVTNSVISSLQPGIIILNITPQTDLAKDIAIDQAGSIIICANSDVFPPGQHVPTSVKVSVVKLTQSGNLDTTFNKKGFAEFRFGNNNFTFCQILKLDQNNNILITGGTGILLLTNDSFFTLRLTPNGKLDSTFGDNGFVVTKIIPGNSERSNGIQLDSQGNIYVAGFSGNSQGVCEIAIVKYNKNGKLVPSFGKNGIVITPSTPLLISQGVGSLYGSDLNMQNFDGKLVLSGFASPAIPDLILLLRGVPPVVPGFSIFFPNNSRFILARYNPNDGSLDTTFNPTGANSGQAGIVATSFSSDLSFQSEIQQTCPAKIIAVGTASNSGVFNFGLARYFAQTQCNFDILSAAIQSKYGC